MTPERRLMLLEKIRARRVARIAVGLPPDALDPEKELEEEEEDFEEEGMSRRRRMWGRWQRGSTGGAADHPRFPPVGVGCGGKTPSPVGYGGARGRGGGGDDRLHG